MANNNNELPFGADITPRTLPGILWTVIEKVWAGRNVKFVQDRPKADVSGPVIAWKIYRRLPGREGMERHKPRHRTSEVSPDGKSETDTYAQWHTIYYQFDIYATTNPEVDEIADDFESLLYSLTGLLQRFGVNEFLFDEEYVDTVMTEKQDVFTRSLRFMCIMEKRYKKVTPVLQQVWLRLLKDRTEHQDVAVVRATSGSRDTLPAVYIDAVYTVAKIPQLKLVGISDYIFDIDFTLATGPAGEAYIDWTPGRAQPTPGDTYFLSYSTFTDHGLYPTLTTP